MNIEERKELYRRDIEAREAWRNGRKDLLCRLIYSREVYVKAEHTRNKLLECGHYALPEHFPKTFRSLTPYEWLDAMTARRRVVIDGEDCTIEYIGSGGGVGFGCRLEFSDWLAKNAVWADTGEPCSVEVTLCV